MLSAQATQRELTTWLDGARRRRLDFIRGRLALGDVATLVAGIIGRESAMRDIRRSLGGWSSDGKAVAVSDLHGVLQTLCGSRVTQSDLVVFYDELVATQSTARATSSDALVPHAERPPPDPTSSLAVVPSRCAMITVTRQLKDSRQRLKRMRQTTTRLNKKLNTAIERCEELEGKHQQLVGAVCFRPAKRNVSVFGAYSMAIARNVGFASAKSTLLMMGGTEAAGQLKSKDIVYAYEHRAVHAQRIMSARDYEHIRVVAADAQSDGRPTFKVCQYRGDATKQEAVRKEKVHVSDLTTIAGTIRNDTAEMNFTRSLADVLIVKTGGGAELYCLMHREVMSVGAPTWLDCVREGGPPEDSLEVWIFCLDNGPDNQLTTKNIRNDIEPTPRLVTLTVWCVMHQYHLIVRSVLDVMDDHPWCDGWGVRYVNGMATLSNVWRSPGNLRKIRETAASLTLMGAHDCCRTTPGRVIKGRWGSIDEFETYYIKGLPLWGPIFKKLFGAGSSEVAPSARRNYDDDGYQERTKAYKKTAVNLTNHTLFQASVVIAKVAKSPLFHFYCWALQEIKTFRRRRAEAEKTSAPCTEASLLSQLVCGKTAQIAGEFSQLLDDESVLGKFGRVWQLVPSDRTNEAMTLIVSLILRGAAGWHLRFTLRLQTFPLILLRVVERAADTCCLERQRVARDLCALNECCLARFDGPHSCITRSLKTMFIQEWRRMATDGKCKNALLWSVLLAIRSCCAGETQEIEGFNSTLQTQCKRAPRMELPLASDRLNLKHGRPVRPADCVSVNKEVSIRMASEAATTRFAPISDAERKLRHVVRPVVHQPIADQRHGRELLPREQRLAEPQPSAQRPDSGAAHTGAKPSASTRVQYCKCDLPSAWPTALPLVSPFLKAVHLGEARVHVLLHATAKPDVPAGVWFIPCLRRYSIVWCTPVVIEAVDGEVRFSLVSPLDFKTSLQVLADWQTAQAPCTLTNPTLTMCSYAPRWSSLRRGALNSASLQVSELKGAKRSAAPKKPAQSKRHTSQTLPMADCTSQADEHPDEDGLDLEELLGQIMEEQAAGDHDEHLDSDDGDDGVYDNKSDDERTADDEPLHTAAQETSKARGDELCENHPLADNSGLRKRVLTRTRAECGRSRDEVNDAIRRAADHNHHSHERGVISLIANYSSDTGDQQVEIMFVRWETQSTAKRVELDSLNRIKYNIPHLTRFPEEEFTNYRTIISRPPMTMEKLRDMREPVQPWILLVVEHAQAQTFSGPLCLSEGDAACALCNSAAALAPDACENSELRRPSFKCSVCVLTWHDCCAKFAAIRGQAVEFEPHSRFVCPMCFQHRA
eukprot:TRINITY_DN11067_c0_g1_i1.p1 TRINITY_DN11067_c0_g1~~TRINITY_DN11067_c0_g1_i1.p1  ORF type:complete len:1330 (-),score=171.22 TRINITY_DN11067_c0_g1_i1:47-4036(-)